MIKIVTVIGARPQIIKASALSRAIKAEFQGRIKEIIVHTGQHYDAKMSQVFFDELQLPAPHYNLNVGSASHARQTAAILIGMEEILEKEQPDFLVLYGDTNSTLAGSMAASKQHVPVVHIEAGLRSFNKSMPEEINRIFCDHVSTFLFSPTATGIKNLTNEGFKENANFPPSADHPKIFLSGDIMLDNSLYFADIAERKTTIIAQLDLEPGEFVLATIHRDNNTDDPERLSSLFKTLQHITETRKIKIILPLHPRTSKLLSKNLEPTLLKTIKENPFIKIIPPVSFLEMIQLEKQCKLILTDSGGVQKEAFFLKKPCIILRAETEWVELTTCGAAIIADTDLNKITSAYTHFMNNPPADFPDFFGNGKAAVFICNELLNFKRID